MHDNHDMSNNRLAVLVYQTEAPYKPHMLFLFCSIITVCLQTRAILCPPKIDKAADILKILFVTKTGVAPYTKYTPYVTSPPKVI